MKLLRYDTSNMSNVRAGECTIRFSLKSANSITKYASSVMGITDKDTITLLQDEEEPEDWYLALNQKNGIPLRANSKGGSLVFNCVGITKKMIDQFAPDKNSVTFKLVTDPQEYEIDGEETIKLYPIITASAK